jgi:hypothetical protein
MDQNSFIFILTLINLDIRLNIFDTWYSGFKNQKKPPRIPERFLKNVFNKLIP